MRTVVDTAPRCRRAAHADRGTNCGCVDQGTLTIGTRLITAKERSLWFAELAPLSASQASSRRLLGRAAPDSSSERMRMIQPAIVESAQAGAGAALYRARAGS
jgi:hypothetical protein